MLTKEQFYNYVAYQKTKNEIFNRCQEFIQKIHNEWATIPNTLGITIQVDFRVVDENTIEVGFQCDQMKEIFKCSTEILYDNASELIELRNIKDVLYEFKKKVKPKKSFWWF